MQVRLFGRPRIEVNGERIETRLSAQGLLLFALLVTHPDETLEREETRTPAVMLHPGSLSRHVAGRRVREIAQHLPAEGGVAVE